MKTINNKIIAAALAAAMALCGSGHARRDGQAEPTYTAVPIVYDKDWRLPYALSAQEWEEIFLCVMSEAGGEPYAGQQAIANCILNKCRMTGKRPSEVIRSDQYATWATGYTESVKSAVLSVFEDGCRPVGDYATIFYAPQRMPEHRSAYHDSQIYVCTIGGHKFFVERRYADLTEKSHPRAATLMVAGTK